MTGEQSAARRRLALLAAMALALVVVSPIPGSLPEADAVVFEPYGIRFQTTAPGDITLASNTLLTCQPNNDCTTAQNSGGNFANNQFNMRRVDIDGDGSTFNSSSADLSVPATGQVVFAGLYWGAQLSRGSGGQNAPSPNDRDDVLLETPTSGAYVPITADQVFNGGASNAYQGFADVTALVQGAGNGTYTIADVQSASGTNRFAGWSLVVVYTDPTLPARNLTVFDGWGEIASGNPVSLTVSGFLTPVVGAFGAKVGMVAYEGDQLYTGDSFIFEGVALSDAIRPTTNFFRSRISDLGVRLTDTNPAYVDQLGFDAAIVDAGGILPNSATSATVDFTTGGDRYFPGTLTTAIDVFIPDLTTPLTKSFVDLNGGDVNPGDVIQYTITTSNVGLDPSIDTVISDPLPPGVTFLPGSLEIVDDPDPANIGVYTDAVGDDLAEYDGGANTVIFRVGTGANATTGGRFVPGESVAVSFAVTVDEGTEDTPIANIAVIDYVSETLGTPFTGTADPPTTFTPTPRTDVEFVSKVDAADPVFAGEIVSYDLTITNNGPSPAADVVITDVLPAGFTFDAGSSDASCAEVGGAVECALGTVAVGDTVTVTVAAMVDPSVLPSTVTNTASVTTSTLELADDLANNSIDETTTIAVSADLSVTKTDSPDPATAGESVTYTITVSNAGPSTAEAATMTDTLPPGTTVTAMVPSAGTCIDGGASVTCGLGDILPGTDATVEITVTVDAATAAGAVLTNSATGSSATPDPDPSNDTATEDTTVDRAVSLDLTKDDTTDPAVAGRLVTYSLTVTNTGPSDTTAVVITDTLPAGVTFDPVTSSAACTESGGTIECTIGDLAVGASSSVAISGLIDPATAPGTITNTATAISDEDPTGATATEDTDIERSADLSVVKVDSTDPATAGGQVTYTVTVTNEGPSDAANVLITDTLPAGMAFASSPTCTAAGQIVTCALGDVAAGGTATADITADIDGAIANGTILENLVAVSSDDPDPDPNNNSSSELTQIERIVDLEFTKSATPDPVVAGENLTYTLIVENLGPSAASNVTVSDPLPAAANFDAVSTTAGTCVEAAGTVDCDLGDIAVGDLVTITIDVTVDSATADGTQLMNTAEANADELAAPVETSENTSVTRAADLSITKTASPEPVLAGENLTYTLTVTNAGPSDAGGTATLDALPAGVGIVSTNPDQGTCVESGGVVDCDLGTVPAGTSVGVEIVVAIPSSFADGSTTANSASVTSDEPDPNPGDNATTIDTDVDREADLSLTKTDASDPVVAGGVVLYTVEVTNNGPSDATAVTIQDDVPPGTVFDAAASTATCSEGGGTVTCDVGDVPAGTTASVVIAFTVDAATADGTVITNTASVTANETDPDTANNDATEETTVAQEADLAVVKVDDPDPVIAGETLTYTIDVTNNGPSLATAATLTDALDGNLSFVSATVVTGGATCAHTGEASGGTVTCGPADLAAGGTATIEIVATVLASASGTVANGATATSDTADPTPSNNTGSASTEIATLADLSITKTATPDPVVAGEQITYTLTVDNAGPSDAIATIASDVLPPSLQFNSATVTAGTGTCTHTGEVNGGTVECDLGTLATDGGATIEVVATVDPATVALSATNAATVSSSTDDPALGDNSASVTTGIETEADLAVTKTSSPDPVLAGETLTSTITVTNNGPSSAASVVIDDVLDPGVAFDSATTSTGSACTHTGEAEGGTVQCPVGDVANGSTVTITVVGTVSPAAAGSVEDTASAASDTTDPDTADNSATATTTVDSSADLVLVSKTAAFDPAVAGLPLTYDLELRNDGPSDALDVAITDTLPAGLTFDGATSDATCGAAGQVITCSLGTVAAGASSTITIGVIVDSDAPEGTVTNTAEISSSTTDPDPSNNTAEEITTIERQAQLDVVKTASPDPVVAGANLTYTVAVTNSGPSLATGSTVGDPLPLGTTFVGAAASNGGTCAESGGLVSCDLGDVASGDTVTVTIVVEVAASVANGAALVNTATADANESDPSSAPTSSGVVREANLSLEKVDVADPVAAGAGVTWQLTVTNAGISDASAVTITDTLPADTTFDIGSSTGGCTEAGGIVTCDVGDVAAGATVTVIVAATVDSAVPAGTTLSNTATVSSPDPDPDIADNTATEDTTVEQINDLAVFKSEEVDPVVAGETVTYLLTATNFGPSNATGIVLTDILPGQTTFVSGTAGCAPAGGPIVTCDIGGLAAGDSIDFVIVATVDPSVPEGTTLFNSASITGDGTDPNADNNDVQETTEIVSEPELTIVKSGAPNPVVAGETLTYTIDIGNAGPSTAANVTFADPLPADTTFASVTTTVGSCVDGQTVTCAFGDLLPGATVVVTIVVDVASSVADGGQLDNLARTAIDGVNDVDFRHLTSVIREADMTVTKSADPDPVTAGTEVTYTLTATNNGPSDATDVVVVDTLPLGVTIAELGAGCTDLGGIVSCDIGDVAAGDDGSATITLLTDSGLVSGDVLTNAVAVSATEVDPDPDNNSTLLETGIVREADLSIEKVDAADPAIAGELVTYIVTVTNLGPSDASGVVVTDPLPAGTTFDALASTSICTEAAGEISCVIGDIVAGDAVPVVISLLIDPSIIEGDTLVNTATVAGNEPDPDPDNNTATEETVIDRSADLSITKTASPEPLVAGEQLTYTIVVTNDGPSDAADVTVIDALPAEVSFVSATPADPTCTEAASVVTCNLGTVAAGSSAEVTIVGLLDPSATGTTANTASVSTSNPDPDPDNNTTPPVESTIDVVTDLSVSKTSAPNPFVPGEPLTYTIVVSNAGPSRAVGAAVSDALPAALVTPVWSCAVSGDGACADAVGSGDVTTTVDLAPGATATITIDATVGATTSGVVDNGVTVTAGPDATDPDESNNTATDTNPTMPTADVSITKTASPSPFVPGEAIVYTIVATNAGPSAAPGNGVVDLLPDGVTDASWTCTAAADAVCSTAGGTGDVDLTVDLPPGASTTIVVTAMTEARLDTALENTAVLLASEEIVDPAPDNNSATAVAQPDVNLPPVAVDDSATTAVGVAVTINVLANDFDPDGLLDPSTVQIVTPPTTGIATVDPVTGAITYTPPPGFTGIVTLVYEVCDLRGVCTTATVTITVEGEEPLPRTGQYMDRLLLLAAVLLASGALLTVAGYRRRLF